MEFFNARIENTILETLNHVASSEFVRLPYTEAIELLEKSGKDFEFPISWGADMQSEHERFLTEEHFKKPVIVYDYPNTIKPFYMYCNDDDKTVRAMDVLVPGVGEIIGGSQREHRLDVLEQRMDAQELVKEDYWWYSDLRRYGDGTPFGIWFGTGKGGPVHYRDGEHSRCNPVSPYAGQRRILTSSQCSGRKDDEASDVTAQGQNGIYFSESTFPNPASQ